MPCSIDTQAEIEADAREVLRKRIYMAAATFSSMNAITARIVNPLGIHCLECANFQQLMAIVDRLRWVDLY